MPPRRVLAAFLIAFGVRAAFAEEQVKVNGSNTRYATSIVSQIGKQPVKLSLTGAALRKKYGFRVYTIASYVQEGTKVRDAEGLAKSGAVKILHMVFEREVDGATIAGSFRDSIALNHPAPAFASELVKLEQYFVGHPVRRGDHVWLTSVPGLGLVCQISGQTGLVIENPSFALAAWEVYLGRRYLDVAVKSGLTSRL